jgi:hypothetical protein
MGNMCNTHEEYEVDTEFMKSAHESKGFSSRKDRKLKANPYAGGANLGRSSIL